jgi:hypothetical protein
VFPYRTVIKLPRDKELILQPFGDIQSENLLHHLDDIVTRRLEDKKRGNLVRMFGSGDYFETHSPSERVKLAGANLHETSTQTMRSHVQAQADDFVKRMWPIRDDVCTILQGHHWDNIKLPGGLVSSDEYIAQKLGAEYAGDGLAWLEFLINGLPFSVLVMHGYGSARTPGARLNKRIEMRKVVPTANWYCMAHDNSMVSDPQQVLIRDRGEITYLKQFFTGIGCLQTSYDEGTESGYAEKLALPPAAIGFVRMAIRIREKNGKPTLDYELRV